MGTCITAVKFVGATSLGLLTGLLAYQSLQAIPDLIAQLNLQVGITAASLLLTAAKTNVYIGRIVNLLLAAVASGLFYTAYKYERHPYLLYAALGAPLAVGSAHSAAWKPELRLLKRQAADAPEKPTERSTELLGKSYIHVSDDLSSNALTPESSTPLLPRSNPGVEQEVDDSLAKKEFVRDLQLTKRAFAVGSALLAVAFALAGVGLAGDVYFFN